jgi:hypothetical protein
MKILRLLVSLILFITCNLIFTRNNGVFAQDFCIPTHKIDSSYLTFFENNSKYGMMDFKGQVVVNPIYFGIDDYNSGLVIALKNDTDLVVLDISGKEVISYKNFLKKNDNNYPEDLKVDWDLSYKDSLFLYLNKFYDMKGNVYKQLNHDYTCSNYNDGLALVADRRRDVKSNMLKCFYGYVNKADEIKYPVICEAARPFKYAYAAINLNGMWGYIDNKCSIVIKPQYDEAWDFNEGLAIVRKNDTAFIIDTLGNRVLKLSKVNTYEWYFSKVTSGLYPVKEKNLYGYIDLIGNYVISPVFVNVNTFNENGLATVKLNKKWGVIDKNGFVVVDFISNDPIFFSPSGIARISYDSYCTYVDYKGCIFKKIVYE